MLHAFIEWICSFFKDIEEEYTFSGWIKDTPDSRDQIFKEEA